MPHGEIIDGRIHVQTQWNERDLVKKIPGARWHTEHKIWHVPLTWPACLQLRAIFGDRLTGGHTFAEWAIEEKRRRIDPALASRGLFKLDVPIPGDPLRDFQRCGVDFMNVAGSALLADDMGLGKTIQMLSLLRLLSLGATSDEVDCGLPAVVIGPKSVKINWAREAATWLPQANSYVVEGGAVKRHKMLIEASSDPYALVMVSYDGLRSHSRLAPYGSIRLRKCVECGGVDPKVKTVQCELHPQELNWMPFKTVILDEAHRIKDPASKQTRAAWAVGHQPHVRRRFALTGTPIGDTPADLWSILHFLAPDEHPVKSTFIDRYALTSWGKYGGIEITGLEPSTRDEFHAVVEPRFRRTPKALVLDQLPPIVRSRRYVELTPKQAKAYHNIESGETSGVPLATRLPDGNVMIAPNDLEAQLRLLQFSSATMKQVGVNPKTDKPQFEMCDPSSKIDELELILEEHGDRPIAVCAEHRQLINLAAQRLDGLNVPYRLIVGGQLEFERDSALRDMISGRCQILLFTIRAGGEGLTMTFTDTLVYLQRSWSMLANLQADGRISRIGAEKHDSLHYIDVIARNTIEEQQLSRLYAKFERLEEIVRDRETLRAAGHDVRGLDEEEQRILNANLGEL